MSTLGALIIAGAVALFAGLVGGNVKLLGSKVPRIESKAVRVALVLIGLSLLGSGLSGWPWRQSPSSKESSGQLAETRHFDPNQNAGEPMESHQNGLHSNPPERRMIVTSINQSGGVTAGEIGNVKQVNK